MNFKLYSFANGTIDYDIKRQKNTLNSPTIVYILDGIFEVTINGKRLKLNPGSFILLNTNEQLVLEAKETVNLTFWLSFNMEEIVNQLGLKNFQFNNTMGYVKKDQQITQAVESLLKALFSQDQELQLFTIGKGYELANILILKFAKIEQNDSQISVIKQYVINHYNEDVNLSNISEHFFMEPSYFSKYFKKNIGVNFKEFLMNIRLMHAKSVSTPM
ncbi:AraC family transcriptional regulator [Pediococcus siamensis]|uniref:AraC family transcriptional regulator n=1 Tax=Pediococcus siamensis TaxID=381829 RepID=UPI0039A0334F